MTANLLKDLSTVVSDSQLISSVHGRLGRIYAIAEQFDINIKSDSTDWDLAREQLLQISAARRDIFSELVKIEVTTQQDVTVGYQDTLKQLDRTHAMVLIYALSIVIVALATGWFLRNYFKITGRNKRLALFAERNPHPIISLDHDNNIIYFNPATERLMKRLQPHGIAMSDLVPRVFLAMDHEQKTRSALTTVAHNLGDMVLSCEIHVLEELNLFDLHISDITAEKKAEEKLKFQAFHYPETDLDNNYSLLQALHIEVDARRPFSLGLMEVRHYNQFIAGHGIESTRQLTKSIARRLHHIVSDSECHAGLYQLNEKTFAVLLDGQYDQSQLVEYANQVETRIEKSLVTDFGEFNIEFDHGYCRYPTHGDDADTLLQHARMALDEAVALEHTGFYYFENQLSERFNTTLNLTQWLKNAIKGNELSLVYQPQLDIKTNRIIGMETLLRWQHDDQWISPGHFIPIAEQSGLIIEIGHWILLQACAMAKATSQQLDSELVLAVNISPRQFRHPNFIHMVNQVLDQTRLPPHQLELEITEGVILYNESETISVLNQLKASGIQLSIDDFGTGYSSLSYLKQFPLDKLKIDQSFVKNLHTNDEDKAIAQAIVHLGRNLNLRTIAEGVEEHVHYEYLASLGCDEIQGYWFSRPLDKNRFIEFVQQHNTPQPVSELP